MSIGAEAVLGQESPVPEAGLSALIDHVARLLAAEYIELMEAAADLPRAEEVHR